MQNLVLLANIQAYHFVSKLASCSFRITTVRRAIRIIVASVLCGVNGGADVSRNSDTRVRCLRQSSLPLCMFHRLLTRSSSISRLACKSLPSPPTKLSSCTYATKAIMSEPAHQNQKGSKGGRKGGGGGGGSGKKLRGLREDSVEVRLSKTVTWILRHGAKSEGIFMRPDGAVRVSDLVSRSS